MSERRVHGFTCSPDRLWGLVGSGQDPAEVLGDAARDAVADLDHHLRRSGSGLTTAGLARDVLAGRPAEEHADDLARLLVPVLASVGAPAGDPGVIWLQDTMFLDWEPVLEELGLGALAASWGVADVAWPWPRGTRPRAHWPVVTELAPGAPAAVAAEFGRQTASGEPRWSEMLAGLDDDAFVDDDGDPVDDPEDVREELAEHLDRLAGWVAGTPEGCSLFLVTDGDL
ncbi:hypothetical protein AB0I60_29710 [Actinosynnema sp. NPDC050436]|uniref:hypothetical protein n=1 Tax=Actinosynnema sp. NPDC050436 TaxID=3155659 RepID=UPI0033E4440F